MKNKEIIPTQQVISIHDERLSVAQLIDQLESYDCPENIIDKLQEWVLDLYLDREKLRKWKGE